ncbi:MAG: hypothetical protein K0Q59_4953 [Paenibacillus sp.]|nr:hypothetical protein [Paenibacillus sp.]
MEHLGKIVMDIGPSQGNPRNSEGAFIDLRDGSILFIYSSFIGHSSHDDGYACLAARHSGDNGHTWSDARIIVTAVEHEALNVMSVSLLRMENGDIGLFYLIRRGWHDTRLHLRRSSDEGQTWGEAACCVPALGYYVTNNDRVIRLTSGRLVIPAAFHKISGNSTTDWSGFDHRGIQFFFLSDDDGKTWREARTAVWLDEPRSTTGLQEPGVIERKDGTLWSWSRTDMGTQFETFSHDGGETWTKPNVSSFTSPASPLSMKRIPGTGELIAVWNPIPNYQTRVFAPGTAGRTPLVGAFSEDEGRTWQRYFLAEREEDKNGCCYTAIHISGDALLLAYCAGGQEDGGCLKRLRMRRIALSALSRQ